MYFLQFFEIYFGIFQPYYRVFFRLFGPKKSFIFIFFFLGKRRIVRFLARIANYYWVIFWLFWHRYSKSDFEHFPLFFIFFRYHYTQIAPYYRPLFKILKPIIRVFLTKKIKYISVFFRLIIEYFFNFLDLK